MKFRNEFERRCFEAAQEVLGGSAIKLLHNHILIADFTPEKGVISFTGAPKKESDVLAARVTDTCSLLIGAKDYGTAAAPPASVQEWASVVRTMNSHSSGISYLGLVVSSHGLTEGCPASAIDHNLGLVPPHKGKPIAYSSHKIVDMLKRVILTTQRFLRRPGHKLLENGNFYWSVYKLLADFPEQSND